MRAERGAALTKRQGQRHSHNFYRDQNTSSESQ